MPFPFHKYQGAGNDFIMVDAMRGPVLKDRSPECIARWCDRRFGIGADGLIILEPHPDLDFTMVYFNSDGRPSSMCGNGGRCIAAFAQAQGYIAGACTFMAADGAHRALLPRPRWVELEMQAVRQVERGEDYFLLDTGSPHYVTYVEEPGAVDVPTRGRNIRYSERFRAEGVNVNFVCPRGEGLAIGTYERGVEDETLACGTGVTAAAITAVLRKGATGDFEIPVYAKGGDLSVRLHYDGVEFTNIWLSGPAEKVFSGNWEG